MAPQERPPIVDRFLPEQDLPFVTTNKFIDPKIKYYYREYLAVIDQNGLGHGDDYALRSIRFNSFNDDVIGVCYRYWQKMPNGSNALSFSYIEVENIQEEYPCKFRALIYHELTHCLFDQAHSEKEGHIMYPYMMSEEYCRENWVDLQEELMTYIKNDGDP
jgi:hypothetical protein